MKKYTKLLLCIFLLIAVLIGVYNLYKILTIEAFVPKINEIVNKNKRMLRIQKESFTNAGMHYIKTLFRKLGSTSMQ